MDKKERILRGISISPGFGIGKVFAFSHTLPDIPEYLIDKEKAEEVVRFKSVIEQTEKELLNLRKQIDSEMGKDLAEFISIQLALLKDREVILKTEELINKQGYNAERAYKEVVTKISEPLISSSQPFFRERTDDIVDIAGRVIRNLLGVPAPSILEAPPGSIVIAHQLLPSEVALLDPAKVIGVAIELGGKTSHTAIMTKALGIPALAGVKNLSLRAQSGEDIVLDGNRGLVIINPSQARLKLYKKEKERLLAYQKFLSQLKEAEAVTADGKHIDLSANIEFLADTYSAIKYGAKGVGLFRTEYLYLTRRRAPTEEEQYEIFSIVAKRMNPYPVIIRTFDLGGDKMISNYTEHNPFLGWRAIRFCLDHKEFFESQLRAILRASAHGNVKIMFPLIATLEELKRAKLTLKRTKKKLKVNGIPFNEECEVGIMVETPSAAIMADSLAKECSFFSIGSNDLTQYTLAVDRGNERVAKLYDHFHPSVLRLIAQVIEAAHKNEIWVGLCGELASDPLSIPVLVGLGIDELSTSPIAIPEVKRVIRSIDISTVKDIAQRALRFHTPSGVTRFLRRILERRYPELKNTIRKEPTICLI